MGDSTPQIIEHWKYYQEVFSFFVISNLFFDFSVAMVPKIWESLDHSLL